jgi:hypothetical protein
MEHGMSVEPDNLILVYLRRMDKKSSIGWPPPSVTLPGA